MRVAVCRGRNDIAVLDVEERACPPGHVKIQVARNGICGSDLHEHYGGALFIPTDPHPLIGAQRPITLGHEFAGTVVDVGDGVRDVSGETGSRLKPSTAATSARRAQSDTTTRAKRSVSTA